MKKIRSVVNVGVHFSPNCIEDDKGSVWARFETERGFLWAPEHPLSALLLIVECASVFFLCFWTGKMPKDSGARYFKVDNLTQTQESDSLARFKKARNYGRLDRDVMEQLAEMNLDNDADPSELLKRRRPWRLQRFVKELLDQEDVRFGVSSLDGYTLRVLNGGVEGVLGKGQTSSVATMLKNAVGAVAGKQEQDWWEGFRLWRSLIGTSLINIIPDRPFSLYVYAKDAVGDDVPIYYLELELNGTSDRHVLVWELDQVLTVQSKIGRPHEAARTSEYASAYQKIYFFMNWEESAPRRVIRAVVSDLPKKNKGSWDEWLEMQHENRWLDAVIAIGIIVASCFASLSRQFNDTVISLIAGVVVAGIASEEWMPPQTILLGAIARFYANESLSLRMYYRTDFSLSIKSVAITLIASIAEVAGLIVEVDDQNPMSSCLIEKDFCTAGFVDANGIFQFNKPGCSSDDFTKSTFYECYCCELMATDLVLIIASMVNICLLLETAFSGVYASFSHSDFPSYADSSPTYVPKIYVERRGFFRQVVTDCRAVEEFCSVYRPLLHWQRGVKNRFLGDAIDLGSPGSPPSMLCYFMASPVSGKIAQAVFVYGEYGSLVLLPLAAVEQLLGLLGGILTMISDIPVVLCLFFVSLLKRTRLFPRELIRAMVSLCMLLYAPVEIFLRVVDAIYGLEAKILDMKAMECRARATARLYRWPMMQSVRTGRSSNHAWKFGDHLYDSGYYRCSDIVVVNPRTPKLGMIEANKLFYKRHKLLWTTLNGQRYINPCLSCGDNTVSRRNSMVARGQSNPVLPTSPDVSISMPSQPVTPGSNFVPASNLGTHSFDTEI